MAGRRDEIESLREALAFSPENAPLRCHLGELLIEREYFAEAEKEFLRALKQKPDDERALLGVARAYSGQGKHGAGLAALDEALRSPFPSGEVYFMQARLLLASGKASEACAAYRTGLEIAPESADKELAGKLGIGADEARSDVVEGKLRAQAGPSEEDEDVAEEKERERIIEKPKIDFAHVGGMEEIKQEIRMKIIYPLTNKDLYAAYGKQVGGGILMYGPPAAARHIWRARRRARSSPRS